ncbi:MAG: molybdopterin synthase catalytic subunit [Trueperaceae bacterium]
MNHFFIPHQPLELLHYLDLVTKPEYGAVASFFGTVRSPNLGENVLYIDYEGYESMIQTQMEHVAATLRETLELGHLVLAHRLGKMLPGEASIAIVASSKHRKEALLACQQGLELCKERLPVWKHEATKERKHWVKGVATAGKTL